MTQLLRADLSGRDSYGGKLTRQDVCAGEVVEHLKEAS